MATLEEVLSPADIGGADTPEARASIELASRYLNRDDFTDAPAVPAPVLLGVKRIAASLAPDTAGETSTGELVQRVTVDGVTLAYDTSSQATSTSGIPMGAESLLRPYRKIPGL